MCSKEGNKDGERSKGHDLGGVAEDTGFVQVRERETGVWPHCYLHPSRDRGVVILPSGVLW